MMELRKAKRKLSKLGIATVVTTKLTVMLVVSYGHGWYYDEGGGV